MLGVQRTSVTAVAATLQERGHIRYNRGRLNVTDRAGLEADSRECYRMIRDEFEQLLP